MAGSGARAVSWLHFAELSGAAPRPVARENPGPSTGNGARGRSSTARNTGWSPTRAPPHARTFVVEVFAGTRVLGRGQGSSKRAAEADAATRALQRLENPTADRPGDAGT
ncbi:MAG: putative dsRNA-binding protein [Kiritimatiellia bacterium]